VLRSRTRQPPYRNTQLQDFLDGSLNLLSSKRPKCQIPIHVTDKWPHTHIFSPLQDFTFRNLEYPNFGISPREPQIREISRSLPPFLLEWMALIHSPLHYFAFRNFASLATRPSVLLFMKPRNIEMLGLWNVSKYWAPLRNFSPCWGFELHNFVNPSVESSIPPPMKP
jgi:hypothetical protein